MMSSGSSTDRGASSRDTGLQPWHFYMLLSLAGATWVVIVARDTHPAALVLLSAAVVAAGLAGTALHYALVGFFGDRSVTPPAATGRTRDVLEREKALVLRSIKELEFDRAMKKVSDEDFGEIHVRLRARALEIMQALDAEPASQADREPRAGAERDERAGTAVTTPDVRRCPSCAEPADGDARFCKHCGAKL